MENFKDLVICPICSTLHKRRVLKDGEEARCVKCKALLYRNLKGLEYKLFSFSISAFIFFIIANVFDVVNVNLLGLTSSFTITEAILKLFKEGFILVSLFSLLVLVVYPFLTILLSFFYSFFLIIGKKEHSRAVLVFLGFVSRWSMLDIFFIAVIVAMIKIFEFGFIEFGIAFWALGAVVLYEFYITRIIKIESLWDYWESR